MSAELLARVPVLLAAGAGALALAGLGAWLVSRWLRRTTHDLGRAANIQRLVDYTARPTVPTHSLVQVPSVVH